MKYSDYRNNIKAGDVIATSHRAKWYGSWYDFKIAVVRAVTQSEYSHVGLVVNWGSRLMVLEAVEPFVRIYPLSNIVNEAGEFYHVPIPHKIDLTGSGAFDYALGKVGQSYSQIDAMRSIFTRLKDDARWECAEYVQSCLKVAGMDITDGIKSTPTDVVLALMRLGAGCILVTKD